MCKEDLALNNLQWLIFDKNSTKPNHIYLIYCHVIAHGDEEVRMILSSRVAISTI